MRRIATIAGMLTRVSIDNYRCFDRFELELGPVQLLMGSNGTGKSSLLDLLDAIRELCVGGARCGEVFPSTSRAAWRRDSLQQFNLHTRLDDREFRLALAVDTGKQPGTSRVAGLSISVDSTTLFLTQGTRIVVNDDRGQPVAAFKADDSQSPLSTLAFTDTQRLLQRYLTWLSGLTVLRPVPVGVRAETNEEADRPNRTMSNLVPWLRFLMQDRPADFGQFFDRLAGALPGFRRLLLTGPPGGPRGLAAVWRDGLDSLEDRTLRLDQLSDGQRMLLMLYSCTEWLLSRGGLLCIDEPDNFIGLREVQPWLLHALDRTAETGGQLLLVSHHPELLNQLATECGIVFTRGERGQVRASPFKASDDAVMTPSELVARGEVGG